MAGVDMAGSSGGGAEEPKRRAVFLDRDGTLIREKGYLHDPEQIEFEDGAPEAVRLLNRAGLAVVLVTNQSGVARGYTTLKELEAVHESLRDRLSGQGARLDAVYACPHHPEGTVEPYRMVCRCRKPETGMVEEAARSLGLALEGSYLVGDKMSDMELAGRAGLTGILVQTGYGRQEWGKCLRGAAGAQPDWVARDLAEAARRVLADLGPGQAVGETRDEPGGGPRWSCKWSSLSRLKRRVAAYRRQGKTLVLANGIFDLLHVGHVGYLAAARALGDALIVAVNDDETAAVLKGTGRPVTPVAERVEILSALACVDHCLVFHEGTVDRVLEEIRPDFHAKGTDYSEETVPERETVRRCGGRVCIVGPPKVQATAELIARMRDRANG